MSQLPPNNLNLSASPTGSSTQLVAVHRLFKKSVARSPEAVAISTPSGDVTYRELDTRAGRLAHELRAHGVGPDFLVGLCAEPSAEMIVGILGILKAGGAYLPLDPAYPEDRLSFMLQDSGAPLVLTQKHLSHFVPKGTAKILSIEDASAGHDFPIELPNGHEPDLIANHLAYVIYTSGSTGKPKGVLVTHGNVSRLFSSTRNWFNFDDRDVWTLFHSFAFDFSVWEIWGALIHGGRLVIVPHEIGRSARDFLELLEREQVTVLNQTPSAFGQLIRAEEASPARNLALRLVIFGGEALSMRSLRPWFDRHGDSTPRLVNMYGITETTVHVTYRPLSAADLESGSVIGIPLTDLTVRLLDESLRPVAEGEIGEICVSGPGLARGYLNRPELTAERFAQEPEGGERVYRSGDLGRVLPGGDLEYLGRKDHQVKIRGFRVELGEIEAEIRRHPSVREAVVIARRAGSKGCRLTAYLISRDRTPVDLPGLRESLKARLPDFMIPTAFVPLDAFPLTRNGKLDRERLPEPGDARAHLANPFVAPGNRLEEDLARIWQEVLGLPKIGVDDHFFELGGDSLLLAQLQTRIEKRLGRPVPMTVLFEHSTIHSFCEAFGATSPRPNPLAALQERARRQREAFSRTG